MSKATGTKGSAFLGGSWYLAVVPLDVECFFLPSCFLLTWCSRRDYVARFSHFDGMTESMGDEHSIFFLKNPFT